MCAKENGESVCWYVLRDLSRTDGFYYKLFKEDGFDVYTPLKWKLRIRKGRRERVQVPVVRDLLFVHAKKSDIDPYVQKYLKIQFRYVRGQYCAPMLVSEDDMNRFIRVTSSAAEPEYYAPSEITPDMCGRAIRIVGGPLDGCEGKLVTVRGSKKKRIMVDLLNLLSVVAEVNPEYIQFVD